MMEKELTKYLKKDQDLLYIIKTTKNGVWHLNFINNKPNITSTIKIGVFASGSATVNVDATLKITPSAPHVNSRLEILAISSGDAKITASPNLLINHNQVKAGHALTTKHINDHELFYLMSRGLTKTRAKNLIIHSAIKPYLNGVQL